MKNEFVKSLLDYQANFTRRSFFGKAAQGIGTIALGSMLNGTLLGNASQRSVGDPSLPHFAARAKRIIYLFQSGAPSHVELFDYKPALRQHHGAQIPASLLAGKRFSTMSSRQASRPVLGEI
ncbi:MAG: DUF1501 domain-containing protein, partial [Bacteroidota bacterium]